MARTQRADLHVRADALLDAAAEILSGAAPREVRIEEVARRAGVGKGTVYLHWDNREHLLLAVAARDAVAMLETVVAAVRADPVEGALHRYLRRHFIEAMRRPTLRSIFIADHAELGTLADHPARTELAVVKRQAAHDHLLALRGHRLLRRGLNLDDVAYATQADRLADVIRRSFEPTIPPSAGRYAEAAPKIIDAFERLQGAFHRIAYGTAAD
jgi:AcrR family transcriptional regulator